MNDRDRATPVTLAGNAPVTQPPGHLATALAVVFKRPDCGPDGFIDTHAIKEARIEQLALTGIGNISNRVAGRVLTIGQHHRTHRQTVGIGEIKVTLVMRRSAENRACSVFHQHEIGDMHRQGDGGVKRMADL